MELTPTQLDEYLEVLRDRGAASFTCPAFSVVLVPDFTEPDNDDVKDPEMAKVIARRAAVAPAPHGNYSHPSLWRGAEPPSFPRPDRPSAQAAPREIPGNE